jgi:hypothetical protein
MCRQSGRHATATPSITPPSLQDPQERGREGWGRRWPFDGLGVGLEAVERGDRAEPSP